MNLTGRVSSYDSAATIDMCMSAEVRVQSKRKRPPMEQAAVPRIAPLGMYQAGFSLRIVEDETQSPVRGSRARRDYR